MRRERLSDPEWCEWVCRRLHAAIAQETPEGLGAWDPAWDVVEQPSRALLEELEQVERGQGDRERVKRLGVDLLAAWRRAGVRWTAAGEGRAA
jgi:hypothetical protein